MTIRQLREALDDLTTHGGISLESLVFLPGVPSDGLNPDVETADDVAIVTTIFGTGVQITSAPIRLDRDALASARAGRIVTVVP